jgi:hypothetical protein
VERERGNRAERKEWSEKAGGAERKEERKQGGQSLA